MFRDNYFEGDYPGWGSSNGAGLFWLTDTTYGNTVALNWLYSRRVVFDLCQQLYDETDWGWNKYRGMNFIPGFRYCSPKPLEFVLRMQALKTSIEARLAAFATFADWLPPGGDGFGEGAELSAQRCLVGEHERCPHEHRHEHYHDSARAAIR